MVSCEPEIVVSLKLTSHLNQKLAGPQKETSLGGGGLRYFFLFTPIPGENDEI